MYSRQLANVVENFFINDDWRYKFDQEKGVFTVGVNLKCKLKECKIYVEIGEEFIRAVATINVSADEENLAAVAEYITRANYGLNHGNFELDFRDGEVRYKLSVNCKGGAVPTAEVVKDTVIIPALMLDRYGDGLLAVLFGFATPADAIKKAEE